MSENKKDQTIKADDAKKDRIIWLKKKPHEVTRKVFRGYMREIWQIAKQRQRAAQWAKEHPDEEPETVASLDTMREQGIDIPATENTAAIVEKRILLALMNKAIQALPVDERDLILAVKDGVSERKIAATFGISDTTVHRRKLAIQEKLREIIENQ